MKNLSLTKSVDQQAPSRSNVHHSVSSVSSPDKPRENFHQHTYGRSLARQLSKEQLNRARSDTSSLQNSRPFSLRAPLPSQEALRRTLRDTETNHTWAVRYPIADTLTSHLVNPQLNSARQTQSLYNFSSALRPISQGLQERCTSLHSSRPSEGSGHSQQIAQQQVITPRSRHLMTPDFCRERHKATFKGESDQQGTKSGQQCKNSDQECDSSNLQELLRGYSELRELPRPSPLIIPRPSSYIPREKSILTRRKIAQQTMQEAPRQLSFEQIEHPHAPHILAAASSIRAQRY
jgi:hypothetical protein